MASSWYRTIFSTAWFWTVAVASCSYGTTDFVREEQVPVAKFGYDELNGPLNWYGLNESANELCSTGTQQSPIILDGTIPSVPGSSFNFSIPDYPNGALFENLGTNVEVVVNGSLNDGVKTFTLSQFHFHTPAEHRVNREYLAMEIHFVLQADDKQLGVLSVLVDICQEQGCMDPLLGTILSSVGAIPEPGNSTRTAPLQFQNFLNEISANTFWSYTGSLTTPPCSENLKWLITQKPLLIDLNTWHAVKKVVKYNARYTQNRLSSTNLVTNAGAQLQQTNALVDT